jgi:hypothetical protein
MEVLWKNMSSRAGFYVNNRQKIHLCTNEKEENYQISCSFPNMTEVSIRSMEKELKV